MARPEQSHEENVYLQLLNVILDAQDDEPLERERLKLVVHLLTMNDDATEQNKLAEWLRNAL
jgi:hypothetical protein